MIYYFKNVCTLFVDLILYINNTNLIEYNYINNIIYKGIVLSLFYSLILSIKSFFFVFTFIWVRASYPRIRFDQLMSFCWTILLPLVVSLILVIPCLIIAFEAVTINI